MKTRPYKLDLQLFAEDQQDQQQEVIDPNANAVEAIKKLKETTVSKEAYEAVVKQNKELFDTVINGGSIKDESSKAEEPSIQELRGKLFKVDSGLNNLEYWETALLLRKKLMEQGETDPFVPVGKRITPEQSDFDAAQRVADVVQECIDYAEGDSQVFTNELQRRTIDVTLPRR